MPSSYFTINHVHVVAFFACINIYFAFIIFYIHIHYYLHGCNRYIVAIVSYVCFQKSYKVLLLLFVDTSLFVFFLVVVATVVQLYKMHMWYNYINVCYVYIYTINIIRMVGRINMKMYKVASCKTIIYNFYFENRLTTPCGPWDCMYM